MPTTLWHIELSHYNEKARWALDHKSIPHVRKAPLPGMHGPYAMVLTRSGHRRLPVLELEGRRIADSTAIIAALEAYRPEPALYPEDPAERARALELEDYFDENLGPMTRRFNFFYSLQDTDMLIDSLFTRGGKGATVMRMMAPAARPIVRLDYGINEESAAAAREGIVAAMDRLESEIQPSGYLVGDHFSVADLGAASMFTPLLAPPERPYSPATGPAETLELREELEAREGGRWVADMYARHRGTSAEVPA